MFVKIDFPRCPTNNNFHRKSRCGFTIVELLVVIAIIGLVTALLLPAVQAAREAARKVSCANNLRQIGIAMHNYESTHRILPPGCLQWRPWGGNPNLKNYAWSAMLLPFLEQDNVNGRIDFNVPFDHANNEAIAKLTLAVYLCPSVDKGATRSGRGRSDYGGLFGQRINTRSATDNGVFVYNKAIRFSEIRDGLSNTMAVSEDSRGPDSEWINGKNVFEQMGSINDPGAWIGDNEIRSEHTGGAMVLFCCGAVRFASDSTSKPLLAAWITRAHGDLVSQEN
jgi:prepilin-type N-terminal cleavage/methylation domain-containing protein